MSQGRRAGTGHRARATHQAAGVGDHVDVIQDRAPPSEPGPPRLCPRRSLRLRSCLLRWGLGLGLPQSLHAEETPGPASVCAPAPPARVPAPLLQLLTHTARMRQRQRPRARRMVTPVPRATPLEKPFAMRSFSSARGNGQASRSRSHPHAGPPASPPPPDLWPPAPIPYLQPLPLLFLQTPGPGFAPSPPSKPPSPPQLGLQPQDTPLRPPRHPGPTSRAPQ